MEEQFDVLLKLFVFSCLSRHIPSENSGLKDSKNIVSRCQINCLLKRETIRFTKKLGHIHLPGNPLGPDGPAVPVHQLKLKFLGTDD